MIINFIQITGRDKNIGNWENQNLGMDYHNPDPTIFHSCLVLQMTKCVWFKIWNFGNEKLVKWKLFSDYLINYRDESGWKKDLIYK